MLTFNLQICDMSMKGCCGCLQHPMHEAGGCSVDGYGRAIQVWRRIWG